MKKMLHKIDAYIKDLTGIAAVEASFIFPIMLVLFFGTLDVGRALMVNQKTIKASQVAADLITRHITISEADLDEAMEAASLSLQPYSSDSLQFDIISVRFLPDGTVSQVWRETSPGMDPVENVAERVQPLADPGSGIVMVVVRNLYDPVISGFVIDAIPMEEVAFARGRRSEVVCREGVAGCSTS